MIFMKDGAKMMRPILTREEYLAQRDGGDQKPYLKRIRAGEEKLKNQLVQTNYSCLPNEDGSLKGSKRLSTTVGMDIVGHQGLSPGVCPPPRTEPRRKLKVG